MQISEVLDVQGRDYMYYVLHLMFVYSHSPITLDVCIQVKTRSPNSRTTKTWRTSLLCQVG